MTTAQVEQLSVGQLTDEQLDAIVKERQAKKAKERKEKKEAYENLKEGTINELCEIAIAYNKQMTAFKSRAFSDMTTLYTLLQEYSVRHADGDGNFKVENADKSFKVEYSRQEKGAFDERADQAEKHIIDFVNNQFASDPKTHKLITSLLERKKDSLDINMIQKLYSMEDDYQDANWKEGIRLLKESWNPSESKDYIRYYKKVNGEYKLINLNFASIAFTF